MVLVRRSVEIAAPVSEVWRWIVEPEKYVIWNTDFKEYRILEEKKGGVGTTFHVAKETRGGLIEGDGIVTEWVKNEKFAFRMEGEQTSAVGTFTLEPTDAGCKVSFEEYLGLKGLKGKIIGALFLKGVKIKNMEEGLRRLKSTIERNTGPG